MWVDEAERIEISVELLAALMAEYSRQLEELYLVTPYDEFKILELKAQRKNHQLELIRVRKGDPQVIEQVLTHYPERLEHLSV